MKVYCASEGGNVRPNISSDSVCGFPQGRHQGVLFQPQVPPGDERRTLTFIDFKTWCKTLHDKCQSTTPGRGWCDEQTMWARGRVRLEQTWREHHGRIKGRLKGKWAMEVKGKRDGEWRIDLADVRRGCKWQRKNKKKGRTGMEAIKMNVSEKKRRAKVDKSQYELGLGKG